MNSQSCAQHCDRGTNRDSLVASVRDSRRDPQVLDILNSRGSADFEEDAGRRGDGDSRKDERGEGRAHGDRRGEGKTWKQTTERELRMVGR